ncbi:MAG: methyltransferase domain-containing protein [Candidatus Cloacimonetes bacterium]|nr:methyltransferase domain-containing protein [Candidatus Cloacimonadota bacterium]
MSSKRSFRINSWKDKDVEYHWDSAADIYVKENERVKDTHAQRFRETIPLLRLKEGSRILNITSRDCEANDFILKANPHVSIENAEISQGLINVAARLRPEAKQTKISSYSELPYEDSCFDRILSLETLEHVSEPINFLKELYRVSTPEALLVLSCPPLTSEIPYQIYTCLFGGHGEGPHRFLPSPEVKEMFKETGWKLIYHKGTVLLPVGPKILREWSEKLIIKFQDTWLSELGIRQIYVCEKN